MSQCNNIRQFSSDVYHFLTDVFDCNLNFSELGMTDHFLHNIVRYSKLTNQQNVAIYKMPWTIESVYGNDIDLFIQNAAGTYNWYALQAKIMSPNGAFSDIKHKPVPIQQWDKLLTHEAIFGSKTYYLLYSGKSKRPPSANSIRGDCIGIPPIEELGAGIVETLIIKNIRNGLRPYANLFFRDVFPIHIDSLRKLFCCVQDLPETPAQFAREEILIDGYQRIYDDGNVTEDQLDEEQGYETEEQFDKEVLKDGKASIRIIITNEEARPSQHIKQKSYA